MDRIAKLKEYLNGSKDDSFLKHALALEYIKIGDEQGAKKLFSEVLENEPGYVGSYYHLAKLLERTGETKQALTVYKKGMEIARAASDQHSYNELQAAYEDLETE